jgi:sec-independent protein translocase protein TatB
MFDIGWGELVLIGIVALIAIGPKELPGVLRSLGHWMTKLRRMASEFQGQFQEAMREAEMQDIKKQVDQISDAARGFSNFDPLKDDNYDGLAPKPENKTATPAPASGETTPVSAEPAAPALPEPDIRITEPPKPTGEGRP